MGFKLSYTKNKDKKVERKDLKRLSSINRIDFLLQIEEIREHYNYKPVCIHLFVNLIYSYLLFILLFISAFGVGILSKLSFYGSIIVLFLKVLLFFAIIEFIVYVFFSIKKRKEIRQLIQEKF